jgi:hypothetical protein
MKRRALALTLILLLISMVAGSKFVDWAEASPQETQSHIMSFEDAIEAANTGTIPEQSLIMFWLSSYPKGDLFVNDSGAPSFLMWLAPNGTFYEAEYPNGRVMGEIGHTTDQENWVWNATAASYIWHLIFPYGEEYTLFANNGTIIIHFPGKYGPPPLIDQPPEPFPTTLVIAITVSVAVIGVGLLVYFKKRKQ